MLNEVRGKYTGVFRARLVWNSVTLLGKKLVSQTTFTVFRSSY